MSSSTSIPQTDGRRLSRLLTRTTAIVAVFALAAWAVATYPVDAGARSPRSSAPTQASVLRQLTPAARGYVLGITSMTPVEVRAAFATDLVSARGRGGRDTQALGSGAPSLNAVLRSLTPGERRYVLGIASLTPLQLWAAFGTTPTPPVGH